MKAKVKLWTFLVNFLVLKNNNSFKKIRMINSWIKMILKYLKDLLNINLMILKVFKVIKIF